MKKMSLDGIWKLAWEKDENVNEREFVTPEQIEQAGLPMIDAKVPGNSELALSEAGILPKDLFFGKNILSVQDYEDCHFWYFRTFDATEVMAEENTDKIVLHFEAVDTISKIYLNGELIGETDNMFIPYEFEAKGLKAEGNTLVVHFLPVCIEARKYPIDAGSQAQPYNYDSLQIRKAGSCFGWDIMPRTVTTGIWRSVSLAAKAKDRIDEAFVYTIEIDKAHDKAKVELFYNITVSKGSLKNYAVKFEGSCGDSSFSVTTDRVWHTAGRIAASVSNAKFWWPGDMGDHNLYAVKVGLYRDGILLDEKQLKLGIRKVRLERTSFAGDKDCEFCFYVNDERLFVKGSNWVPVDAFHSRDKERLPAILPMLTELGCNAVRCWGGNVYEDDIFYDYCDENGIVVWQDFAMGCGIYPQDERFQKILSDEADIIIKRLRNHPSIILWAGDNECDCAYGWGGLNRDPNANLLTRVVLKNAVERNDPTRPYLPSSPYIDQAAYDKYGCSDSHTSEQHIWGPRDYFKAPFYANTTAHFASETGYHGCNSPESMKRFISEEKLWPWNDNDEWLVHAATMDGTMNSSYAYRIELMAKQVREMFGYIPDNLEQFAVASQISQAEAFKFFIEHFRTAKWRRTGIIWWNLIDGWPQFSDAVVDYYGYKKRAFDYIKRSQYAVGMMFDEPNGWTMPLMAVNDTREEKMAEYQVTDLSNDRIVLAGEVKIPANSACVADSVPNSMSKHTVYLIEWKCGGATYKNHYLTGKPPYDLDTYIRMMEKVEEK